MAITYPDAAFIGVILTELFFGFYVAVFCLYARLTRGKRLSLVDYGVFALFGLSVVTIVLDALQQFFTLMRGGALWSAKVNATTSVISITLDFLSQLILRRLSDSSLLESLEQVNPGWPLPSYRYVGVIWRAFLSFGFSPLADRPQVTGLVVTIDMASVFNSYEIIAKGWWVPLGAACMGLSLAVKVIFTALILAKIHSDRQGANSAVNPSGGAISKAASILLQSAVLALVAQLVYLTLYKTENPGFSLVAGPVTVIYGLNCTAILAWAKLQDSSDASAIARERSSIGSDEKVSPV
ncbi:hypothetical protein EST38_g5661 [Candolleomyces aberdarensis]|uniref:Uncharacterized protein n=1 Tax=Candolleomyces aberdarensis TaxID=2316362 RepID=A0A4Q2DJY7_9AGAR|nr:hypothetical protein EST38_g5661 [Candolleomyces aberdarensis]